MKKVLALNSGSTIAVISPSWGGPASFPWVYELGINRLKKDFGFRIKEYPTTMSDATHNYKHPEKRALDLIEAFQDESVDGIICSIGGDDAVRLLPYLDKYDFLPKFFMGYSDSTVLLVYFHQRGFCTFHGPSVMAGFAEPGKLTNEFYNHIKTFLTEKWETYCYSPYKKWTEKPMNWSDSNSLKISRNYQKNEGWEVLGISENQSIEVSGMLWGGCLEALEFIKGTKYWPASDTFWEDKILFLEISDEGLGYNQIKFMLRNYGTQGVFSKIQALLVGRFVKVTPEEKKQLKKIISDIIHGEFSSTIPVIMDMDFGHTYPQQIMPLGARATVNIHKGNSSISIETPFIHQEVAK
ncbi:MAG: S66 peptidase family protein [bacterium]